MTAEHFVIDAVACTALNAVVTRALLRLVMPIN